VKPGSRAIQVRFTGAAPSCVQHVRTGVPLGLPTPPEDTMSTIVKVVEVIAQSKKSFDDAAQQAVREAAASVRGIKSIWIENFSGVVEGDRIVEFRVNAKLSFVVEGRK
jgi:flavin-binding protein dodecin